MIQLINKIESELNKFALTLGDVDVDTPFEDEGTDDYIVQFYATKEPVKNVFLTLSWRKMSSGEQFQYSQEGSKLVNDVHLIVNLVDPADMDDLLNDDDNDDMMMFAHLDEESLEESYGRRIVHKIENNNKKAVVYKNYHTGEHEVEFHKDGNHLKDGTYFTDDEDDAIDTAKYFTNSMDESYEMGWDRSKSKILGEPGKYEVSYVHPKTDNEETKVLKAENHKHAKDQIRKKFGDGVKIINARRLDEELKKPTKEDPLVTVHDKDGMTGHNLLSVMNDIHKTNIKHTDFIDGEANTISGRESKKPLVFKLSKWNNELQEESMSPEQEKKREDIVKGMKKNFKSFRKQYGDKAKEVMYATATKMAMNEEQLDEVSKESLSDYIKAASKDAVRKGRESFSAGVSSQDTRQSDRDMAFWKKQVDIANKKADKRLKYISKASDKLTESSDDIDTITLNVPAFIRCLEHAMEDVKEDAELHEFVEELLKISKTKDVLTMDDYEDAVDSHDKEQEVNESKIIHNGNYIGDIEKDSRLVWKKPTNGKRYSTKQIYKTEYKAIHDKTGRIFRSESKNDVLDKIKSYHDHDYSLKDD